MIDSKTANKANWIGASYYFSLFIGAGSFMPFIYVYLDEFGLSGQQIGWLATLGPIVMLTIAMPIAAFADKTKTRRRLVQAAQIGTALSIFLMQFSKSFMGFAILMLVMAIFNSISSIAESLTARMAKSYNLNYGAMRLWGSFAFAVSSLAFGAIWEKFGFEPMFIVAGLLYLPLAFIAGKLEEGRSAEKAETHSVFALLKDTGLLLLIMATFLASVSNSMAMTFSGIYAKSLGGGNFLVGLMISVGAFAELPAMYYNMQIERRIKAPNAVILSYAVLALGFLGYIFTPTPALIPVFSVFKGLGYGLWITLTIRMITQRTPDEWASTAQSLITVSIFGLAPLVANPLGGWLNDAFGTRSVYWLGVGGLVLAAMILIFAIDRKYVE